MTILLATLLIFALILLWRSYRPTKGGYYGEWWYGSMGDKFYEPKPWERRAYAEGLRDALRIGHAGPVSKHWHDDNITARELGKLIGRAIHERAKLFEGDGSEPCK